MPSQLASSNMPSVPDRGRKASDLFAYRQAAGCIGQINGFLSLPQVCKSHLLGDGINVAGSLTLSQLLASMPILYGQRV